ncbi:MAG: VTT domain-containing protein [Agathobacter sp.]|nr:VTT domain-containing protein [Agathobacter sp.]
MKKSRIILLIAVILFATLIVVLVGKPMIRFISDPEAFQAWVDSKGIVGIIIFMVLNILQVILAIIPGGPFEIAAGYAFGIIKGSILCDIAMTAGSMIIFFLVRKFGMRFIELFVDREKVENLAILKTNQKKNALLFLFFLLPGTPKDLLSYAVGLTDIKISTWLLINLIGRFPAILLSAMSGSSLVEKRYEYFAIFMGIILFFYLIGAFIYRRHNNKISNDTQ